MPYIYKKKVGRHALFKYTKEAMDNAIRESKNNRGTLRSIAKKYSVPKSTLSAKVREISKKNFGGQLALSPEIEQHIKNGLLTCAEWGFPLRTSDVADIVQNYLNAKKKHLALIKTDPKNLGRQDF